MRYVGDPALNNFHIYAHCADDGSALGPAGDDHARLARGRRGKDATVAAPAAGPVRDHDRQGEPVCESIEIAVPSDGGK